METYYEIEHKKDNGPWTVVGGRCDDLFSAIVKRDYFAERFGQESEFRVIMVIRTPIDVKLFEGK